MRTLQLFVMRHGPAAPESSTGRDADRELSPEGRLATLSVADAFAAQGGAPAHIVASPLVRTRQTAEIVAAAFASPPPITFHEGLCPGEDLQAVVDELSDRGLQSLLVVAHAPDVSLLLRTAGARHDRNFEPGMLVGLDVQGRSATERFVLRPSELSR